MINYKIDFLTFNRNQYVKSDCGDITFFNNGTDNVVINGSITLTTGQSLTISANYNEIDRTIYYITFPTSVAPQITILRKIYI
tara:strand:+ start:1554 stop:1802 length:249 start_codon:yes stop_codon:yes gene_type:complete